MEQERLRLIEDRLYGIERQLAYFDQRLKRLEPEVAPPPQVTPMTALATPPAAAPPAMARSPITLPPPREFQPASRQDTEYLIGAKLLPKLWLFVFRYF